MGGVVWKVEIARNWFGMIFFNTAKMFRKAISKLSPCLCHVDSFCIGDNKLRLYFDRDVFSIIFLLF